MAKAILLLSGGLDSTLAGKLLLESGVQVEALNFTSPFCNCTPKGLGCSAARMAADQLGIPLAAKACGEDFLERIKYPRHGTGSGVNACIDCRIYKFSKAKEYMKERGADFLATGEVLGERPMSQRRRALAIIEEESGLKDQIVRPLSARHFAPTVAEQQGLVDREQLLNIQGRCRKPQMALADELGIKEYLCPAGGCLLTEQDFAIRFREMQTSEPDFRMHDAKLLRYGRHFRLPSGTKAVVGRNHTENARIERLARENDVLLEAVDITGPTVIVCKSTDANDLLLSAQLLVAYARKTPRATVRVKSTEQVLADVARLPAELAAEWKIGIDKRAKTA